MTTLTGRQKAREIAYRQCFFPATITAEVVSIMTLDRIAQVEVQWMKGTMNWRCAREAIRGLQLGDTIKINMATRRKLR
jgi:PIN domain nuclease of toxin-antitoxin system